MRLPSVLASIIAFCAIMLAVFAGNALPHIPTTSTMDASTFAIVMGVFSLVCVSVSTTLFSSIARDDGEADGKAKARGRPVAHDALVVGVKYATLGYADPNILFEKSQGLDNHGLDNHYVIVLEVGTDNILLVLLPTPTVSPKYFTPIRSPDGKLELTSIEEPEDQDDPEAAARQAHAIPT